MKIFSFQINKCPNYSIHNLFRLVLKSLDKKLNRVVTKYQDKYRTKRCHISRLNAKYSIQFFQRQSLSSRAKTRSLLTFKTSLNHFSTINEDFKI
ncbi:hypothetical protein BpHYR1_012068 [Brachionus plicatilis]|uniref:Uncharacterized protein n=1 Tax=Brachionus plicatilis TaxID=10195 RepID=A0A3M7SS08_BRAPC|nr:hypothetical protein BpHYR1_012068 [Brachionus plicatilis]